jgi:hypothetical protein
MGGAFTGIIAMWAKWSHIAKVSSLVGYDSGMVCLPQQSPVLLLIYLKQD